jgi:hypothetical protein
MRSTIRAVVESSSTGVPRPKRRRRPSLCNHFPCSHQSRMPGGPSYSILIKSTSISRLSSSLPNTSRETPTQAHASPRLSLIRRLSPSLESSVHDPMNLVCRWKRLCKSSGWQVECEPNSPGANVDNNFCEMCDTRLKLPMCTPRPNPCSHP